MSEKLSDLLVPNLIERFDSIPSETLLTFGVTKGDLAYLIKSNYQLHQGLGALIRAVQMTLFVDDAQRVLDEATAALQAAQNSFGTVTTNLINKAVAQHESAGQPWRG